MRNTLALLSLALCAASGTVSPHEREFAAQVASISCTNDPECLETVVAVRKQTVSKYTFVRPPEFVASTAQMYCTSGSDASKYYKVLEHALATDLDSFLKYSEVMNTSALRELVECNGEVARLLFQLSKAPSFFDHTRNYNHVPRMVMRIIDGMAIPNSDIDHWNAFLRTTRPADSVFCPEDMQKPSLQPCITPAVFMSEISGTHKYVSVFEGHANDSTQSFVIVAQQLTGFSGRFAFNKTIYSYNWDQDSFFSSVIRSLKSLGANKNPKFVLPLDYIVEKLAQTQSWQAHKNLICFLDILGCDHSGTAGDRLLRLLISRNDTPIENIDTVLQMNLTIPANAKLTLNNDSLLLSDRLYYFAYHRYAANEGAMKIGTLDRALQMWPDNQPARYVKTLFKLIDNASGKNNMSLPVMPLNTNVAICTATLVAQSAMHANQFHMGQIPCRCFGADEDAPSVKTLSRYILYGQLGCFVGGSMRLTQRKASLSFSDIYQLINSFKQYCKSYSLTYNITLDSQPSPLKFAMEISNLYSNICDGAVQSKNYKDRSDDSAEKLAMRDAIDSMLDFAANCSANLNDNHFGIWRENTERTPAKFDYYLSLPVQAAYHLEHILWDTYYPIGSVDVGINKAPVYGQATTWQSQTSHERRAERPPFRQLPESMHRPIVDGYQHTKETVNYNQQPVEKCLQPYFYLVVPNDCLSGYSFSHMNTANEPIVALLQNKIESSRFMFLVWATILENKNSFTIATVAIIIVCAAVAVLIKRKRDMARAAKTTRPTGSDVANNDEKA